MSDVDGLRQLQQQIAEALPHAPWCDRAAANLDDDDLACVQNRLEDAEAVLPVVTAWAERFAADEIERLAEQRVWTTQHDNEVVSVRDLYEQVARLRGELKPVTYDFPPAALADDGQPT